MFANITNYLHIMNIQETTGTRKNSFTFVSLGVAVVAICLGLLISLFPVHREYYPVGVSAKDHDDDHDAGAKGEEDFFFNARKNITTQTMDYQAMLATDIAVRAEANARNTHSAMVTSVPDYNWMSMGPTNVGGRTRAILIDNTDPTHQTIFAAGVSGGIWKSTNGGGTWGNSVPAISYSLNDTMSNINVSCLAQDANGVLYAGTGEGFSIYQQGEGFSTGILGGGIFKSTDDGATWHLLPKTAPSPSNSPGVTWGYVNRIAIRPDSPSVVYAATQGGLYISHDGGASWNAVVNPKGTALGGAKYNALDVKISTDGSVIMACIGYPDINTEPSSIGCYGYYCYPQNGADNVFTEIKSTGLGKLNGNAGRIEFAISPTDPNRVYASVIASSPTADPFEANSSSGIFMTMTAKTNGGYWYDIGPGGSLTFDPYAEPGGGDDQAYYDNTLGVPPANEAQVLCGGTTLWEWSGTSPSDTVGNWNRVSHYGGSIIYSDPLWIHADEHAIVFDQNNPQTVYVGCDGGIFKCTNWYVSPVQSIATSAGRSGSINLLQFQSINRNYNVTQYYTICFSPKVDSDMVPVSINNGTSTTLVPEHLGVGGGTQDNGSPYINGSAISHYPNDGVDMSGGDGAGAVVSQLVPTVGYFCSDYGALERENNLLTLSPTTSAYTQTKGYNKGGNIDTVWSYASKVGGVCFVFPVALYENIYDTLNHDSTIFISTDSNYKAGNTVWPLSATGNIIYPYKLPRALKINDTITVPDRVVSKLAVGFAGSLGGLWVTGQAASDNVVVWIPFAGTGSTPDAFTGDSPVHALVWTPDGNTLFAGTEDGHFFRFSNMNSIIANEYKSGALFSNTPHGNVDTTNQVVSTNLSTILNASGRDILSIAVDPANGNNVMVTLGNYGNNVYVYYSSNALSASPTFTSVQGNLPDMPVYSSVLDLLDSTGHYITNSAMIATEHGIYTTPNITLGSGTKWVKNSDGLANCLTLAVKQQTTSPYLCNNSGVIYVGTHGRGIWSAQNAFNIATAVQNVSTPAPALEKLLIYPNPMTDRGNIEFELSSADNVTIDIYDMQGKVVKSIEMETQSPGSHTVTFESTGLREGTYFAALTGSDFRKVSKFVVIR